MAKKLWAFVAPVLIIFIGIVGFVQGQGLSLYDALISSLKLPTGYLDPLPFNIFLEIARWLGIIYISSMFFAAIYALINSGTVFIRARREDAVAVHGDSVYAGVLLSALGKRGIPGESRLSFKAPTQVVFFSTDKDSLDYYQRYSELFDCAKIVHLCLNDTYRSATVKNNVFVLNISEAKAINYWQKNYIHENKEVAIIGSGQLAEKLLYWGLQMNVFNTEKNVSYSVLGDFCRFNNLHPHIADYMMEYGGDSIVFYDKWYEHMDVIRAVDRIILCGETNENVEIATLLSESGVNTEMHVFIEGSGARTLFDSSNIEFVGDLGHDDIKDLILMDKIHESGKICNIAYDLYENDLLANESLTFDSVKSELQHESAQESWEKLDSFTKGSNYSSAMHDIQKYLLLKRAGINVSGLTARENEDAFDNLNQDTKDYLQEIEHIRWARYHFLNNWKAPDNNAKKDETGKKKDPVNRTHANLVPYCDLPKDDQDKDGYYYKTLSLRFKEKG